MTPGVSASLLALLVVLAADAWVFTDAKVRENGGAPVVVSIGSFEISRPVMWFVCCVVLWIVFFPLYVVSRNRAD